MPDVSIQMGPWRALKEIGKGGQGVTYKAVQAHPGRLKDLAIAMNALTGTILQSEDLYIRTSVLADVLKGQMVVQALKVLHEVGTGPEAVKAKARMKNEILAMQALVHPNLIRLLDFDQSESRWYVTEFQPNDTLTKAKSRYTGKALKALRDLHGVVEAVALIHERGVHRDIKPDNIFLNASNGLVLGDFGLIFFDDQQNTRYTGTLENVGSRDWMPGWALSMKQEEVKPTFDVFGLGKTLYSMVSKKQHLRLWYHKEPDFDLLQMFPGDFGMEWINYILEKSVVEHERQIGYKNASEMLVDIEIAISEMSRRPTTTPDQVGKRCAACGLGKYEAICEVEFPLQPNDTKRPIFGVLTCSRCGHSDLFAFKSDENTPWKPMKMGSLNRKVQPLPESDIKFHDNAWWRRSDSNPLCMACKIKGGELIPLMRTPKSFICLKCDKDFGRLTPPLDFGIQFNAWPPQPQPLPPGAGRRAADFDPLENT
jgi:serine/threonine protein kinase